VTVSKRIFDLVVALILCVVLLPVVAIIVGIVLITSGRPVFYVSERMRTPLAGFWLVKFRTMTSAVENSGVSGGDKSGRITKSGHFLRSTRLDEIPQLWNVIKGDISFVGPRPPLRQYVEEFPELYSKVLESRPGITGLASVKFHAHEERLLARTSKAVETDEVYTRICIPRKANLDLIYQQNQSLCFDIKIMYSTVFM